jgi:hypothetical protein
MILYIIDIFIFAAFYSIRTSCDGHDVITDYHIIINSFVREFDTIMWVLSKNYGLVHQIV